MTKVPVLLTIMLFSLMLIGCNAVGLGTGIDITELKKQQIQECQKELINIREDGVASFRECLDQIELRSGSINLEDAKNQAIENILFEEEKDKSIVTMQKCLESEFTKRMTNSTGQKAANDFCKSQSRKVYKGDHKNLESEEIETDLNVSLKTAETCLEEAEEIPPTTVFGADTSSFKESLMKNCLKAAETTFDLADGTDNFDETLAKGSAKQMHSVMTECMNRQTKVYLSTIRKQVMCEKESQRAFENYGGSTQKLVPTTSKKISASASKYATSDIKQCSKDLLKNKEKFQDCLKSINPDLETKETNLEDAKNQAIENILFEEEKDKSIVTMQKCLESEFTKRMTNSTGQKAANDFCKSQSRKVYKGDHKNLESEEIETDLNVSLKTAETCLEEAEEIPPTTVFGADTSSFKESLMKNCLKAAETTFDLADGTDNFDETLAKGSAKQMHSVMTECMNRQTKVYLSTIRKQVMCEKESQRAFENYGGSTQKLVPTTSKKISDSTKESNNNAEHIIEKFESRIDDLEEQIEELQNILKELIQ